VVNSASMCEMLMTGGFSLQNERANSSSPTNLWNISVKNGQSTNSGINKTLLKAIKYMRSITRT